jgi:hypothetical protein
MAPAPHHPAEAVAPAGEGAAAVRDHRGGEYFFIPGIRALEWIAEGQ